MATISQRGFLIIGHRGARGHAPENTLAGLNRGIALGAQMLEFDVQRCGTELVLLHDPRLERTTNGHGRLADLDFAAVRRLDAGHGERIPTLDEALDCVAGRVPVNIEIKSADGTGRMIANTLRGRLAAGAAPSEFLVSSFHLPELARFRAALPEVPTGALVCGVPIDLAACASAVGASYFNISEEFIDRELVDDAHARGLRVLAYTVNAADEFPRLRDFGIDGVFTDYPDRAMEVLR